MDKNTFFKQLHQQLADKYNTTPEVIQAVRNRCMSQSPEIIIAKTTKNIEKEKKHIFNLQKQINDTIKKMNGRQFIINFILQSSETKLNDILQKTQYDN